MSTPALDVTWEDWNLILDTTLPGTFFTAQAVASLTRFCGCLVFLAGALGRCARAEG